jgi:hypothetical protein
MANPANYLRSLAGELRSQAARVRELIGARHWATDGAHKEHLLAAVIRRHLPGSFLATRGFVVSPIRHDLCSREQDIVIVDTVQEAPLFNQSDVIISFASSVRAVVSVKTTFGRREVLDAVDSLRSVRDVVVQCGLPPNRLWCGAFFFEPDPTIVSDPCRGYDYVSEAVQAANSKVERDGIDIGPDMMATAENLLFRQYGVDDDRGKSIGFVCDGLASAVFLGRLLDHLATERGAQRADFADFASVPEIRPLASPERVFPLSPQGT